MQTLNFARLVRISYHLRWIERFVCLTSGVSLSLAIVIASVNFALVDVHLPFMWLLETVFVLTFSLATDTQLIASVSAFIEAGKARNWPGAGAWLFVVVILIPPAAVTLSGFGLVTSQLAPNSAAALLLYHLTPFIWISSRGPYGVFLLIVSCATRPWAEKSLEQVSIPQIDSKVIPLHRKRPGRASTSRKGRPKRQEVAMTLWREAEAARLYEQNTALTIRQLASQLAYTEPTTGRVYTCATETAAGILRALRRAETAA